MTLDRVTRGQRVTITAIPEPGLRMMALRFGLIEGITVECDQVIPSGAIVVRRKRQQLALGRALAAGIEVATLSI